MHPLVSRKFFLFLIIWWNDEQIVVSSSGLWRNNMAAWRCASSLDMAQSCKAGRQKHREVQVLTLHVYIYIYTWLLINLVWERHRSLNEVFLQSSVDVLLLQCCCACDNSDMANIIVIEQLKLWRGQLGPVHGWAWVWLSHWSCLPKSWMPLPIWYWLTNLSIFPRVESMYVMPNIFGVEFGNPRRTGVRS